MTRHLATLRAVFAIPFFTKGFPPLPRVCDGKAPLLKEGKKKGLERFLPCSSLSFFPSFYGGALNPNHKPPPN